ASACGGPMQTDSSAMRTCSASLSAVEYTATVAMPSSRHARMMRMAIVPRFATSNFLNIEAISSADLDNHCLTGCSAACLSDAERRDQYSGLACQPTSK